MVDMKTNSGKKYLRQPSIDFDFCNISSSCDVVYKGHWLTQAGYWFILPFCEHFACLSSKIQNAIQLENISNLITSPSSYQCIRRKTRLVHFVIHDRHISMECMIPKCKFSKQMIKKYLVTEYVICRCFVCLHSVVTVISQRESHWTAIFVVYCNNISAISWRSVLLVEENGELGENYRPVASHWQFLSHNAVRHALIEIRTHNISGESHRLHR
jgi:hypothetical protein